MSDLKFAFRQLLKNPGFTVVAVLTLALGIGANLAIFTLIKAVLFKPIMARDPDQLVGLFCREKKNSQNYQFFSYPDFQNLRAEKQLFQGVLALSPLDVGAQEDGLTRSVKAHLVSANYFSLLDVAPKLGRGFLPEEEAATASVVVLSHSYWMNRGADPEIVGQAITLNNISFTVVGVMTGGFTGTTLSAPSVFLPLGATDLLDVRSNVPLRDPGNRRLTLVARLQTGQSRRSLDEALSVLSARISQPNTAGNGGYSVVAAPVARFSHSTGPAEELSEIGPVAGLSMGLSFLVLVIVCLNLANMLLARGVARGKEIAVRLAIGAGRGRIIRQLLTESLLLALCGGVGGMLAAMWTTSAFVTFARSNGIAERFEFSATPDFSVLLTSLGFCGIATVLFALGPAWRLTRQDVGSRLKENAAEDASPKRTGFLPLRDLLVVCQVALSLALVLLSALFTRSAARALEANPGFAWDSNFMVKLQGSMAGYEQPALAERYRGAMERVRALPGVASASFDVFMPFGGANYSGSVQRAGSQPPVAGVPFATAAEGKPFGAGLNVIGTDYFRTLGLPLLRGREFTSAEVENSSSARVAVINRELAQLLWPGEDPLGKRLQFTRALATDPDTSMEVVGLAPSHKQKLFDKQVKPFVWVPYGQDRRPTIVMHVRVASGVDSAALMQQARAALKEIDTNLPVTEVTTLRARHQKSENVRLLRMGAILFGAFGLAALLLAAVGVYGVKAFAVARRTREIGIRMALGASGRQVLSLLLREGAKLTVVGLGLGVVLAAAFAQFVGGFLYEITPLDPWAFASASAVLGVTAMLACWIPARRAAKVDPMEALRCE